MNVKSVAIPNTFFENEEINWIEKYLYCNLMLDADENLIVKMSQKQLGKEIGKSENSIRKYINSLVNHGFIEKRLNSENKYEYKLLRYVDHLKRGEIDEQ